MAESHRDRALRALDNFDAQAHVHALLAIEDRLDVIARALMQGGDIRRMDASAPTAAADQEVDDA